ncbi:hypothetical protein SKA58_19565 [Sphingomonas sp. SKA58]|jgi:hypothetical protein|uniref:hypothetical protein n=1 Tax=Sphingomonas sp. (strain SKA58) TaxID=314266 RepID=UPI0000D7AA8E|nr:hypothetical protein [Sphingomonas sp. SKA58]EAT07462.1 hypothetical protein SKA58_19565 [Sphingomonas sp. SKA58]
MTMRFLPIAAIAALTLGTAPAFAQTSAPAQSQPPASSADPLEQRVIENLRAHLGKEPPQAMIDRLMQQIRNAPGQAAANRAKAEKQAQEMQAPPADLSKRPIGALDSGGSSFKSGEPVTQLADATPARHWQQVVDEMERASKKHTRPRGKTNLDCDKQARRSTPPAQGALCDPREHRKRQAATKCVDCPEKA